MHGIKVERRIHISTRNGGRLLQPINQRSFYGYCTNVHEQSRVACTVTREREYNNTQAITPPLPPPPASVRPHRKKLAPFQTTKLPRRLARVVYTGGITPYYEKTIVLKIQLLYLRSRLADEPLRHPQVTLLAGEEKGRAAVIVGPVRVRAGGVDQPSNHIQVSSGRKKVRRHIAK